MNDAVNPGSDLTDQNPGIPTDNPCLLGLGSQCCFGVNSSLCVLDAILAFCSRQRMPQLRRPALAKSYDPGESGSIHGELRSAVPVRRCRVAADPLAGFFCPKFTRGTDSHWSPKIAEVIDFTYRRLTAGRSPSVSPTYTLCKERGSSAAWPLDGSMQYSPEPGQVLAIPERLGFLHCAGRGVDPIGQTTSFL